MQHFEIKPMALHQLTLSQAPWEIRLSMQPEIMKRDNGNEGEHNGKVHDRKKKKVQKI